MVLLRALACIGALMSETPAFAADRLTPLATCVSQDMHLAAGAVLAGRGRFDCARAQTGFGPGDFWVRAVLPRGLVRADRPLVVRVGSLWQHGIVLHARYADGVAIALPLDDDATEHAIRLGAMVQWTLPARATPVAALAWQVSDAANVRGIVVGAQIGTREEAASHDVVLAALYAAFGGLCIALLVYNIGLWGALRHRFQLVYCVMVAGLFGYALTSSGALALLGPGIGNAARIKLNYLLLGISGAAALEFARCFFEPLVFAGWLNRVSRAITVALAGSGILILFASDTTIRLLDGLYCAAFVTLVMLVGPVMWRAWRMRSNYLWLFAMSWAAPIVLAIVRIANNLHWLGWSFFIDNSTLAAMAVEALLSSFAIAYRIRLLSIERDEARAQEIAARLLADTDPLTGLLNRRSFLAGAIGRAGEHRLLLADLDHFKLINETIGHDGGDEVLRLFAQLLRTLSPDGTLVARLGGEEFAVLLPRDVPIEPDTVLDRLRAASMPYDLRVTASIGVCAGPIRTEADWKHLYRRADQALFDAKAAGRDRTRVAAPLALAA